MDLTRSKEETLGIDIKAFQVWDEAECKKQGLLSAAFAKGGSNMSSFVKDAKTAVGVGSSVMIKGTPIIVLVDGDLVAYRCAAATNGVSYDVTVPHSGGERLTNFKYHKDAVKELENVEASGLMGATISKQVNPEPLHHAVGNMQNIMKGARQYIQEKLSRPVKFEVYLTSDNLFREDISPTYKKSRESVERPANLKGCKEWLTKNHGAEVVAGYEADDLLAIRATEIRTAEGAGQCIIMSLDKDLRQIWGLHYDFTKCNLYEVGFDEARRNFWAQTLMGDKTDDIPGIHGIGPITAHKILDELTAAATDWDYYKQVVETWVDKTPKNKGESKRDHLTRVMTQLGTSCRLLWLSRELGDLWDAPKPTVTSDSNKGGGSTAKTEAYDTVAGASTNG